MEDLLYYTCLFDYYKDLFTKTKQDYFIDYYFNNLTQEEIAENYKVSKNAVSKTLKEVKEKLDYYEEKLKLYHNKEKIKTLLSSSEFTKIEEYIEAIRLIFFWLKYATILTTTRGTKIKKLLKLFIKVSSKLRDNINKTTYKQILKNWNFKSL